MPCGSAPTATLPRWRPSGRPCAAGPSSRLARTGSRRQLVSAPPTRPGTPGTHHKWRLRRAGDPLAGPPPMTLGVLPHADLRPAALRSAGHPVLPPSIPPAQRADRRRRWYGQHQGPHPGRSAHPLPTAHAPAHHRRQVEPGLRARPPASWVVHWDDDDWSAPWRLRYQVEMLRTQDVDVSGLNAVFFFPDMSAARGVAVNTTAGRKPGSTTVTFATGEASGRPRRSRTPTTRFAPSYLWQGAPKQWDSFPTRRSTSGWCMRETLAARTSTGRLVAPASHRRDRVAHGSGLGGLPEGGTTL